MISPLHYSSHQLLHATQRHRVVLSETCDHFSCNDQTAHDTIIIVLLLVVLYRDVIVMFTIHKLNDIILCSQRLNEDISRVHQWLW